MISIEKDSFNRDARGSNEPLLSAVRAEADSEHDTVRTQARQPSQPLASMILFILSFGCLCATIVLRWNGSGQQACVARLSMDSPLLDAVEYSTVIFNNSFAQASKYRGPPTPRLEAEWEALWSYRDIFLPSESLPSLIIGEPDTKSWKKVPESVGDGYYAGIEAFHQLHCLNMIRQYTWGTYYERHGLPQPSSLRAGVVGNRMHVDHCIETLRLTLMCHGDTTPILREVDANAPIGDSRKWFSNVHKCVDFEVLRTQMAARAVEKDTGEGDMMGMPGMHVSDHHRRK